jgi:hypothetical protein
MIPNSELFTTESRDPREHHWPHSATLRGTHLTLYSQHSVEEAIGYVQHAMVEAFIGSYAPLVLTYRGKMVIIWRDAFSRIAFDLVDAPAEEVGRKRLPCQISGYREWAEAERDARFLLAQAAWDGEEEASALLASYPGDQAQFGRWTREQKASQNQSSAHPEDGRTPSSREPAE